VPGAYVPKAVRIGTCKAYGIFDAVPGCFAIELAAAATNSSEPDAPAAFVNAGVSGDIKNEISARSVDYIAAATAAKDALEADDIITAIAAAFDGDSSMTFLGREYLDYL
jgi:hypothetical protein